MEKIEISLTPDLKEYLREQIGRGRFSDPSDFMRTMLRADREAYERLDNIIQDGLDSGVSDRSIEDIIDAARERLRSHAA